MSTRHDAEFPMYFGAGRELFGLFHPAAAGSGTGVLLCPPLGQDQIRCHRLYRQLAHALVAEGVPVLRFDYFGTGDSAGDSSEVDWDRCVADTVTAAGELRLRGRVDRIIVFGARLGGSLALAAAAPARFSDVVVWDPVTEGSAYAACLDAMQVELGKDVRRFAHPRTAADTAAQWLGFPISSRLREQIAQLRLAPPDAPVLLLDSVRDVSTLEWTALAMHATVVAVEPATAWDDVQRIETAILSHPLIQAVVARLRPCAEGVAA